MRVSSITKIQVQFVEKDLKPSKFHLKISKMVEKNLVSFLSLQFFFYKRREILQTLLRAVFSQTFSGITVHLCIGKIIRRHSYFQSRFLHLHSIHRPGIDSLKNCKFYDSSRNVGCSLRCHKKYRYYY